ncbi:MAG TPA: L-glutamate gamma-semialdehyde dehydrogenase [Sedimentisphaerales bacterium]|jgi:RHH-type proline utilization regulon transcriptional repressor/proline dehydrogenase/delta 1-pyrroline-5-carboxylate dehydrogenase|nr:L-glutamate gamma-semialdehyde dehydrogenase [Sedimentisphaerales bacterium]HNU31089.1 L-glutamate gamma-semialdehyde dehydrogenase [Sedimentisphaerales bacterium]
MKQEQMHDVGSSGRKPEPTLLRSASQMAKSSTQSKAGPSLPPFKNERVFPGIDDPKVREGFPLAIAQVRKQLGRTYPLYIDGREIATPNTLDSVNPANPNEIIGTVCQAGQAEAEMALCAAERALLSWRDVDPVERARYLVQAADVARRKIFEYSAWQVLEEGKQWAQAYNDLAEGIDFLEYCAREMIRLGTPQDMGSYSTESNHYFYQPKGVAVVIAPWNFPFAISCGMSAAAIVAGNPVVYKPSSQSMVVGHHLVEIFREVGLPAGVFNYVPGPGAAIGDYLVDSPKVSVIAFTGSMNVGLRIIERAGRTPQGQDSVKHVVCEMGGKNAILLDDEFDEDAAIRDVLYSAFGYQGQKCSACSRLIVHDKAYDRFVPRLVEAAKKLRIGPAEDPANYMGPVIDDKAQRTIQRYADLAAQEGRILYRSEVPQNGYYVPMTIVEGITPDHRIAQEEVFGPVLAIMRAKDFDQALQWANSTRFALTGAVFSKNREHLDRAVREFRVGNLYLNRGCVGALVKVQPFGGFKMSGGGTKAGGPDYLLHFMDPRCVTAQP